MQGGDGGHLILAAQHASLELEVVEAVARVSRLGQPHDRCRCERGLVPEAKPWVFCIRIADIGQIGLLAIADVEEVSEHLDLVALLAFAKQRGHRQFDMLAKQIE